MCNSIATIADLAAADLEEIQQETSEAIRGARLQVRTAKVAGARTKLEHDRNALAQAEAAAREAEAAATVARGFAQSETDLKETEVQIGRIEGMLERLIKRLIPTDEVVGFVEEIELSAQGIDVGAAIIRQNSGAMTTVELAR